MSYTVTVVCDAGRAKLTSEASGDSHAEASLEAFGGPRFNRISEAFLGEHCVAVINYAIDNEVDWAAGEPEAWESMVRAIKAAVLALTAMRDNVRSRSAIEKAKSFLAKHGF